MDKMFSIAQIEQWRDAQKLKKQRSLSMHDALDVVAQRAGFQRWSHLMHAAQAAREIGAIRCDFGFCSYKRVRCVVPAIPRGYQQCGWIPSPRGSAEHLQRIAELCSQLHEELESSSASKEK